MFESHHSPGGGGRAKRRAILEAENAQLRRLLAEQAFGTNAIRLGAERPRSETTEGMVVSARSRPSVKRRMSVKRQAAVKGLTECDIRLAAVEDINAQLRASEEFNRRILSATTDCVMVLDLDGRLISMNECGLAFFGAANFAQIAGRPWAEFWAIPESRNAIEAALDTARGGRTARFQAAIGTPDTLWWDIAVAPMNGVDGRPERILAVSRDITEIKQNEARQTLLMQELSHRVKNTLAMVQAVATQTLRNARSLDEAGEALSARLLALAQAHDVLMQGAWSSADLRAIVDTAVTLHSDGVPDRFVVAGPDLTLGARPGLTLALILHELGTNAAKYGALSRWEGHVAILWGIGTIDGVESLCLRWEEIGGPPVKPPTRIGFGSRLIERSLIHSFGGTAKLSFPETGVVLTMEAPLAAVVAKDQMKN